MTREEQILELLWPADFATRGTEIYAVLDGARDPRIHHMVGSSELAWRCLYAGALPAELREVAPYLAHMQPDASFTRETISSGWGHAWGIWMISAAPFDDLRRHLRRFLRVQDEAGRRLLFRYYDPIVLATFLPTCTAAELAALFGPIDAFLIEAGSGPEITELRFDGDTLHTRIRTADPSRTQTRGVLNMASIQSLVGRSQAAHLVIRDAHREAMYAHLEPVLRATAKGFLRLNHGRAIAGLSEETLDGRVARMLARGRSHGLTSEASLVCFTAFAFEVAPNFDEQPQIRTALADAAVPPEGRIEAMLRATTAADWEAARASYDDAAWETEPRADGTALIQ